ncbi:carboxypeptidase M32 [Roseiterribacter gracilis]|uniref:Metal-dependent carboxypeptidase n=1 Tax=Roseiterribacter gracilis TaxID=2812848 RepID=A0A8S8XAN9_9PROT|nr:carboxypeptidase M32 [Rhodospirillales bacterium TMPK1]
MKTYRELELRFARLADLSAALAVLGWDERTMMPAGASPARAETTAGLRVLSHELLTGNELGDLLDAADAEHNQLDDWQRANLHEMRWQRLHATAVPADLVHALALIESKTEMAWRAAKPNSDFPAVRPLLEETIKLVRESAVAKAELLGLSPYDALMDQYDPGLRTAFVDPIFDAYAAFLPAFLERVLAKQASEELLPIEGPFALDKQRALALEAMRAVGFDFNRGRLDESLHPFCGGAPGDVRITTRYDEHDFARSLMGVLHETGHAMYELGLPESWRRQPVGEARGMTVHESQSLLVEMQACRGAEFLSWLTPQLRDAFGGEGPAWSETNLRRHLTRVRRSLIRVDADEVTYPAHVILRYRLERGLLSGDLPVADLPEAWNHGLDALLGVRPPDDRRGCLQDIHWYAATFGYFATYSLGAMTAAQLFAAAEAAEPNLRADLARGDFRRLMGWLGRNVHAQGRRYSTEELVTRATGRALDPTIFQAHLQRRYLDEA